MGKKNLGAGFLFMGGFMAYGFVLIYLQDFAPGNEEWIAAYAIGAHFEARLAHVHGNLFALMNILIGYLLLRLPVRERSARTISWLALAGMLIPLGIIGELLLGLPCLGHRRWREHGRGGANVWRHCSPFALTGRIAMKICKQSFGYLPDPAPRTTGYHSP